MKRAIVIVLDGCGAGFAPDAAEFNDPGEPNTLKHVWEQAGGFHAPHLASLGFFQAAGIEVVAGDQPGVRTFGRLQPLSKGGKDSVTGHWEMMGIIEPEPFPTYPSGFPISLIKEFEARIGRQTLGNRPASGTQIIAELGALHVESGCPIVYTSADSVFQIACHEDVIPIDELYRFCEIARELCTKPNHVQRVIARPFVGEAGSFSRTERRKDYPLPAPRNRVDEIGDVFGVGVVPELFGGRGFRPVRRTQSNAEHAAMMEEALASDARFIFANFEDFDMLYGHRNDPAGFATCLETFDVFLGGLLGKLREGDLLILTADHGNDPTDASTDHSREFVPVSALEVVASSGPLVSLGDQPGFGWIGERVVGWLSCDQ